MAEATSNGGEGGGGRGLRFWKKKSASAASGGGGKPEDASKTGCGGFFRRVKGRRKAPIEKESAQQHQQQEAGNGRQSESQPTAPQTVQITFDDVELPEPVKEPTGCGGGDGDSDGGSSVHSICEEVVCLKAKQAESAWVRPPVVAPVKEKPKLALAKMASKDGADDSKQPRRPSADKPPTTTTTTSLDAEPQDEAEVERQRMAEARFQRKSVDMRSVKAKGGVKIEQSPQAEMWWNIVNKSLVGTGLFARAVACSLQSGGIFACNPADFAPTTDQVAALRDNFQNPGAFAAAGFAIGGVIYKVEPGGCTRDLFSAVNLQHTEGLLAVKSQTAMLIGGFAGSRDQATETLCAMRDLFMSQGL